MSASIGVKALLRKGFGYGDRQICEKCGFSAAEPNAPPLLTINVPIGLQYGSNPEGIVNHSVVENAGGSTVGLQVNPHRAIALIGGELNLEGGFVNAPSGNIELGAVAAGTVRLTSTDGSWQVSYFEDMGRENISLSDGAIASTSGESGGRLQVFGGDVSLTGRSQLLADTLGDGDGAGINIDANNLRILDGSLVGSSSFGAGDGGDINIRVDEEIEVRGVPDDSPATQISTIAVGETAGDIIIDVKKLLLIDGGIIFSGNTIPFQNASPEAKSGDIQIRASESIDVIGPAPSVGRPTVVSGIFTGTFNEQRSSDITIETGRLRIAEGGLITNSSLATGQSGDITIVASDSIELSGVPFTSPDGLRGIASRSLSPEAAVNPDNAGNITITTPQLTISDGNTISVGSLGPNSGGNISVTADFLRLGNEGRITAATASGEGGNITLQISRGLRLRNQSEINAQAEGTGNGGDINIEARTLALLGSSRINANAIEGMGGNISIFTRGFFQSRNSSTTASSELGIDGVVNIQTQFDLSPTRIELSSNLLGKEHQIIVGCRPLEEQGSFIVTGRGGLPESPLGVISPLVGWYDLNDYTGYTGEEFEAPEQLEQMDSKTLEELIESATSPPDLITEATGWVRHPDGRVELVENPQQQLVFAPTCR